MVRRPEPAMWPDREAEWDPDRISGLRRGWALLRWVALIMAVGLGAAALVAIAAAIVFTALDANL